MKDVVSHIPEYPPTEAVEFRQDSKPHNGYTHLEESDRMRGDVARLKLKLAESEVGRAQLAVMLAQTELLRARQELEQAQAGMDAVHADVQKKYDIDWGTHRVRAHDGKIITVAEADAGSTPR